MNRENWRRALQYLPRNGGAKLEEFLDELERGHNIGLPEIPKPVKSRANPPMDNISKCKMATTILKWHSKNYLMGPFDPSDPIAKECRINPVFCVPKPDNTVRPVVNYSKKIHGTSLNDFLDPEWCTVEYIKLKEIVYTIYQVGQGAMLWAKDLEDGYFNIKVEPTQAKSMAFIFAGLLFIPMVMIFGLSSAPLIFTIFMWYVVSAIRLADRELMWKYMPMAQFENKYFQTDADAYPDVSGQYIYFPLIMYYLDDIFGVQTPDKVQQQYKLAGQILKYLGLSAKESKDRPPNTVQKILGLLFDTVKQEVRIPIEKVKKYVTFARSLMQRASVTKKQLFSLTGKARHVSVQCHALSAFARGVEIHGHKYSKWHHHVKMTNRLKCDINLLIDGIRYIQDKGISFEFILKPRDQFDLTAYTDASGSIGIGGFVEINNAPFFQVNWDEVEDTTDKDIQWKELVAICVLFEINVDLFRGKCVHVLCDNISVIYMLIKWRADLHRKDLQHLLRRIARLCIFNDILPYWDHIDGVKNVTADRLSRCHHAPFEHSTVSPGKLSTSARVHLQKCIDLCAR